MNKNSCNTVQENLAWGRSISQKDKVHIMSCEKCSQVAYAMENLDSLVKNEDLELPENFADNVMKKIENLDKYNNRPAFQESIVELLNHSLFRWGIGGVGFLVAFSAH